MASSPAWVVDIVFENTWRVKRNNHTKRKDIKSSTHGSQTPILVKRPSLRLETT